MDYTISRAKTEADFKAIQEINLSWFVHPIDTSIGWWWVVSSGTHANIVAFAGLHPSEHYHDTVYFYRVAVAEAHQGHGLQKRLIRTYEQFLIRGSERPFKGSKKQWVYTDTSF